MRGNELQEVMDRLGDNREFSIPMRGNESTVPTEYPPVRSLVFDPHEG